MRAKIVMLDRGVQTEEGIGISPLDMCIEELGQERATSADTP